MPEQKTYVPKSSAKEIKFGDGSLMKLSFNADALIEFVRQHKNERGWINLNVTKRREPSERGDTHSISLDTWKPGDRRSAPPQRQQAKEPPAELPPGADDNFDVPF